MTKTEQRRWIASVGAFGNEPKVDAFLVEVAEVCARHGFVIEHEDVGGAFVIERYPRGGPSSWLLDAHIGETVPADQA